MKMNNLHYQICTHLHETDARLWCCLAGHLSSGVFIYTEHFISQIQANLQQSLNTYWRTHHI